MVKVSGYLVQSYMICRRQAWFYSREVTPHQEDDLLEIGRLIHEGSYKRERKEIEFNGFKIDLLRKDKKEILIAEVKKSSKAMKSAKMQLLFYLYKLKRMGVEAKGEILVPKERKREKVELTEEAEAEIKNVIENIQRIISLPAPPEFKKTGYCRKCAYRDFCFA